ncbi:hypothetical protein ACFYE9_03660 [Rhizobium leguminosarum]|uniref:Uncharacterized protein n=2 Tax=Rhizobium leguminosarum TaxID=384 RepID=A0ACD5FGC3_RHILE|nr:hypothetical protein [Rhizobium leguminosarum]
MNVVTTKTFCQAEMISKINDEFALELREVRATGSKLRESIDQHNFLPDDFPKEQINLLLVALHGLEDGSLEGARLPLEHANVRLSEIRRRYFVHRDQGLDGEDESPLPVLERGDSLDARFSQLLSAISTALDAYREQSRSEYESLNTDEYIDILPGIAPANIGIAEGLQQINQFAALAGHARETRWAESVPIQDVALSAADAGNSLASVRAEASSQFVIRGWIKKLARFSADALNVLGKTLDAVSVAGQIAHEFYLRYKATVSKIREVVIKEAQEWLSFLASKIKDAESVVRRYADDHERKNYGIVEAIGRNSSVINHQRLPFAITSSERFVPRPGTMVEFDIDTSHFHPAPRISRRPTDS